MKALIDRKTQMRIFLVEKCRKVKIVNRINNMKKINAKGIDTHLVKDLYLNNLTTTINREE